MIASRPLQNRVDPYGALVAVNARGSLMGNRGGRFHRPDQTLGRRRWASRQWISCLCAFQGRHRSVWGVSYTELFFLDEPTALAAGHRPCFVCRRAFAVGGAPSAPKMDAVLHRERLADLPGRHSVRPLAELPDGVMVERNGRPYAVRGAAFLPWSFFGCGAAEPRPVHEKACVLTPPAIVAALAAGYRPRWAEDLV